MLSLYEILKASKTGIAPDMWTALAGMNWGGADSGHEVKELTGIPPLSFTADGTPLLDYLISGNMSQSGTPTLDNPIQPQETGERTGNLFDGNYELAYMAGSANAQYYSSISNVRTAVIPCKANTKYSIKRYVGGNRLRVASYTAKPTNNMTGTLLFDQNSATSTTVTAPANAEYLAVYVAEVTSATEVITTGIFEGETIPSTYIPYGYKIPILSVGQTTPVFLGEVESTRRIKKRVFTGTEQWSKGNYPPSGGYQFFTSKPSDIADNPDWLTTHFKKGNELNGSAFDSYLSLYPEKSILPENATTNDFKSWLAQQYAAGTPVTVWYSLATPETAVVNEPLRKIGDYADTLSYEQAGVDIPTNRGNTVIDVLTTLKPSEMYIKYQE